MKNLVALVLYVLVLTLSACLLAGCQVVGDIFGAGVYTGIFLVVVVVVVVIVIVVKMGKK